MGFSLYAVALFSLLFSIANCQPVLVGTLEAVEGDAVSILCMTDSNAFEISLVEDGVVVQVNAVERISLGFLNATFREFILADTIRNDQGRSFQCGVSELRSMPPNSVDIFYNDPIMIPDILNFVNGVLTLAEGSDYTLPFSNQANPNNPVLTRGGGGAVSDGLGVTPGSITFTGVQRSDAGPYTLTVSNQAGTVSTDFSLTVEYGPEFNKMPIDEADADCVFSSSVLTCGVDFESDVTIDCQFNSVPMDGMLEVILNDPNITNVRIEDRMIVIENVTESNFGRYECVASNLVAGANITRTLTIVLVEEGTTLEPSTDPATAAALPETTRTDDDDVTTTESGTVTASPVWLLNSLSLLLLLLLPL